MSDYQPLRILGFDHIEFAVADLDKAAEFCLRLGFEKALTRQILERKLESHLFVQNDIYLILSRSQEPNDPVYRYVANHGDGVIDVAFRCEDATTAFELVVNRGAKIAETPKAYTRDFGTVEQASIRAPGDLCHTFIARKGNFFAEGFEAPLRAKPRGHGLQKIDHVTLNVEPHLAEEWIDYYRTTFGLAHQRSVLQSPDGMIRVPVNELTESPSQIEEYLEVHHGPGIQHIAFTTHDMVASVQSARKEGIKFLEIPRVYYQTLANHFPSLSEGITELENLGILVDKEGSGYLLQIFTQHAVGPLAYELIQRKGNEGFGEGNGKILAEAVQRDQIRRGAHRH